MVSIRRVNYAKKLIKFSDQSRRYFCSAGNL